MWCDDNSLQLPSLPGFPVGLEGLQCQYLTIDGNPVDEDDLPYEDGPDRCRQEIVAKDGSGGFLAEFSCPNKYDFMQFCLTTFILCIAAQFSG